MSQVLRIVATQTGKTPRPTADPVAIIGDAAFHAVSDAALISWFRAGGEAELIYMDAASFEAMRAGPAGGRFAEIALQRKAMARERPFQIAAPFAVGALLQALPFLPDDAPRLIFATLLETALLAHDGAAEHMTAAEILDICPVQDGGAMATLATVALDPALAPAGAGLDLAAATSLTARAQAALSTAIGRPTAPMRAAPMPLTVSFFSPASAALKDTLMMEELPYEDWRDGIIMTHDAGLAQHIIALGARRAPLHRLPGAFSADRARLSVIESDLVLDDLLAGRREAELPGTRIALTSALFNAASWRAIGWAALRDDAPLKPLLAEQALALSGPLAASARAPFHADGLASRPPGDAREAARDALAALGLLRAADAAGQAVAPGSIAARMEGIGRLQL